MSLTRQRKKMCQRRSWKDKATLRGFCFWLTWVPTRSKSFGPRPEHPLVALCATDPDANLVLTPHIASVPMAAERGEDFEEIERFLRGEPLRHSVL